MKVFSFFFLGLLVAWFIELHAHSSTESVCRVNVKLKMLVGCVSSDAPLTPMFCVLLCFVFFLGFQC